MNVTKQKYPLQSRAYYAYILQQSVITDSVKTALKSRFPSSEQDRSFGSSVI